METTDAGYVVNVGRFRGEELLGCVIGIIGVQGRLAIVLRHEGSRVGDQGVGGNGIDSKVSSSSCVVLCALQLYFFKLFCLPGLSAFITVGTHSGVDIRSESSAFSRNTFATEMVMR